MKLHERALVLVVTVVPWSLASQLLLPGLWRFACGVGAFLTYSAVIEIVLNRRANDPEDDQ